MHVTQALTLTAASSAAHLVIAMVMAVYARHQRKYLALAVIMAIFAAVTAGVYLCAGYDANPPGVLHPAMLLGLVCVCYLQSIYPLSFVMPGYLQWRRMVRYALPAVGLILIYIISIALGNRSHAIHNISDISRLSLDMFLRLAAVALSIFYIINIFRLPRRMTKAEFPRYLIGYSVAMGLSAIYYVVVCFTDFNLGMAVGYLAVFTLLNLYLCLRTLETMAIELPKPVITEVKAEPTAEDITRAEWDFNEANHKRFQRVEFYMQHHLEEVTDNTFGRDRLCEQTGINRHLLLQCLRSKGYNNAHDYISSYRIAELKRMIENGEVQTLSECQLAGFGTTKTARLCFEKHEGTKLETYLNEHKRQ